MAGEVDAGALAQAWVHSFEEDTADEHVYRPEAFDFPPARRPREIIELRPGGEAVLGVPGPDDRRDRSATTWALHDGRRLTVGARDFEVLSAGQEKLVVRPGSLPT